MDAHKVIGFSKDIISVDEARRFDRKTFDIFSTYHLEGASTTPDHHYAKQFIGGHKRPIDRLLYITVPDPFSLDVGDEESIEHMGLVIAPWDWRRVIDSIYDHVDSSGYSRVDMMDIIPQIIGGARKHAYLELQRAQTPA